MMLVVHQIVLLSWVEISVGHTRFLVKVESMWVQDLECFLKPS